MASVSHVFQELLSECARRHTEGGWEMEAEVLGKPRGRPGMLRTTTYRGLVNRQGSVPDDRGTEIPRTSAFGETNGG